VLFPYERVDKDSACRCLAKGRHTDALSDCNYSSLRLCWCGCVVAWYSRRMFSSDNDSLIVKLNELYYSMNFENIKLIIFMVVTAIFSASEIIEKWIKLVVF